MSECWCSNSHFKFFNDQYSKCENCGTLVSLTPATDLTIDNTEIFFYGKDYWFSHQSQDLGLPNIYERSRSDLTERNLHWLKTVLKYRLPPAELLDLGCSHGSFVAVTKQAGYHSVGVEMSPWVVEYGKHTFHVPIHLGPVEDLAIPSKSLDVISLMDVLEHLPQPHITLKHCSELLKEDGILIIQTPCFDVDKTYQSMLEEHHPFLSMLIPDEHIFLFSKHSVKFLLESLGFCYIYYEPALFDQYDMFFVASRVPLLPYESKAIDDVLTQSASSRLVLALLDLRDRELQLVRNNAFLETDRAARLDQIHTLSHQLKESEADRAQRLEQIHTLSHQLKESETDRAQHLEQIHGLTAQLEESKVDRSRQLEQIHGLTAQLKESEIDRGKRLEQIQTLTTLLKESEIDRGKRLEQIQTLTTLLKESENECVVQLEQVKTLTHWLKEARGEV